MARIAAEEVRPGLWAPLLTIEWSLVAAAPGTLYPQLRAIVDSGADTSILPGEILPVVGLAWEELEGEIATSRGIGGEARYKRCAGSIKWGGYVIGKTIAIAEPSTVPFPLLGRDDFFRRFVVHFRWAKNPPEMDIVPAMPVGDGPKKKQK